MDFDQKKIWRKISNHYLALVLQHLKIMILSHCLIFLRSSSQIRALDDWTSPCRGEWKGQAVAMPLFIYLLIFWPAAGIFAGVNIVFWCWRSFLFPFPWKESLLFDVHTLPECWSSSTRKLISSLVSSPTGCHFRQRGSVQFANSQENILSFLKLCLTLYPCHSFSSQPSSRSHFAEIQCKYVGYNDSKPNWGTKVLRCLLSWNIHAHFGRCNVRGTSEHECIFH